MWPSTLPEEYENNVWLQAHRGKIFHRVNDPQEVVPLYLELHTAQRAKASTYFGEILEIHEVALDKQGKIE